MALFSVDFYSKSLFRPVNFKLFVPNDVPPEMKMGNTYYERPTKILVLLHGYNGGNLDWALYSNASEISSKYNLAVILPSGENSFYLDSEATGHKYVLQFTQCSFKASQQAAIPLGRFGELWATRFCFASCSLRPGALPSVSLALINRRWCLCREDTGQTERAYGMEKRQRSLLRQTLTALWRKQRPSCKEKS